MKLVGITGGIGMGKTTCSNWVRCQGHPVVDTDEVARELTMRDANVLEEIRHGFGEDVFETPGKLNREALARVVFADKAQRFKLEAVLHPRIRSEWLKTVESWRNEGIPLGFVVIPLLYETVAEASFGRILCVGCSAETQLVRLAARGWSVAQIEARISSQMSAKEKMGRADFVIWTEGRIDSTEEQLKMVLRRIAE